MMTITMRCIEVSARLAFCALLCAALLPIAAWGGLADDDKDVDKDKERAKRQQEARAAFSKSGAVCQPGVAFSDLDVNNVRARLHNNGMLFFPSSVYEVPKGSGLHSIYASGIWIGGQVGDELRVAASTYAQFGADYEFFPGPLDEAGSPPADCSPYDRLFKVSRDDIASFEQTGNATDDMRDWPWEDGAPVVDGDGVDDNYNLDGGDLPQVVGDQTIWWVMNDAAGPHLTTLTPPIGLEVQVTAFAFRSADALNNTTFYRYKLIYRGDEPLENTFIGLWSDPDLGQYTDDFVGSDTTLGLGFVYNGDPFDEGGSGYQNNPPALGYDFFQGPLVEDDGVDNNRDGEVDEPGERLKMTRFVYYNNDNTDQGNPADADDFYGYLRGRWKDGSPISFGGDGFGDDLGLGTTNFMFTGDPPSFWSEDNTDGQGARNTPADRRFIMSTGPFTMQPGDVQEIVFGIIWSQTPDRIGSVKKLKSDDILAQGAFDFDFEIPSPPDAPRLSARELDGKVVLTWDYPTTSNNYLNQYDAPSPFLLDPNVADTTYTFEGFKIVQYASPDDYPDNGVLVATLDVPNDITTIVDDAIDLETGAPIRTIAARGTDSGVRNFLVIENDHVTGEPLKNFTDYYYGVQAYAYNPFSAPTVYQSPVSGSQEGGPLLVTPSTIDPREGGLIFNSDTDDVVAGEIGKLSDAIIYATVADPGGVTGDTYELRLYELDGELTYDLANASTGDLIVSGREMLADRGELPPFGENVIIHDGLSFTITDAPADVSGDGLGIVEVAHPEAPGGDPCHPDAASLDGCPTYNGNTVWHSANSTGDYYVTAGATGGLDDLRRYITFASPRDFELRFTDEGGYAVYAFTDDRIATVPFEIWDIGIGTPDDPSDDRRMIPFLNENEETADAWGWGTGIDPAFQYPMSDWIYWMDPQPGTDGYEAFEAAALDAGGAGATYPSDASEHGGYFANFYGGFVYPIGRTALGDLAEDDTPPPAGTVIRFTMTKPLAEGDVFAVDTGGLEPAGGQSDVAQAALDDVAIVPNPYRGASGYDVDVFQSQARITNLPERATIRVYALNGTLVRTLEKSGPGTFLGWDLRTEEGLPVSSGIYLVHVRAPEVGEKIMKFGVVQKRIQLDVY